MLPKTMNINSGSDVIIPRMEAVKLVAKSTFHGRNVITNSREEKKYQKIRLNVPKIWKLQSNGRHQDTNTNQTELFIEVLENRE